MKSAFGGKKIIPTFLFALFIPAFTFAASAVSVTYPGAPGPIFSETNLAPGDSVTKTITVTNGSTVNEQFKFRATASTVTGILADKINIRVLNTGTAVEKYNDTLANLYSDGEIDLDVLAPATPTQYSFIATFDASAENEYQGLEEVFDLAIGFAATPTTSSSTGGGGSSTPAGLLTAFASSLGFSPTVVGFVDKPAVAGAVDVAQTSEVKGAEDISKDIKTSSDKACPWWWIIAIFLGAPSISHAVFSRRKYIENRLAWLASFGVVAWISHYFLHKNYESTIFCDWYWLVVLVIVAVSYAIYRFLLPEKDNK